MKIVNIIINAICFSGTLLISFNMGYDKSTWQYWALFAIAVIICIVNYFYGYNHTANLYEKIIDDMIDDHQKKMNNNVARIKEIIDRCVSNEEDNNIVGK